jgi:hypothetical protein
LAASTESFPIIIIMKATNAADALLSMMKSRAQPKKPSPAAKLSRLIDELAEFQHAPAPGPHPPISALVQSLHLEIS